MTGLYNTPKVLHIIETDCDGNQRTVRYYREDTIVNFVENVRRRLDNIENEADRWESKQNDTMD